MSADGKMGSVGKQRPAGPCREDDADVIATGVDGWCLANREKLVGCTSRTRRLAAGRASLSPHDARHLIAGDVTGLAHLVDDGRVDDAEFCERCIALRGEPLSEIRARRLARERARIWLLLAGEPTLPATTDELLRLYEVANRAEPHFCTTIPARFRTDDDPIPFTLHWNHVDRVPLKPGFETIPGSEIPQAVRALLAFMARTDIPCEWVAFASYFLVGRIHPFRDGNGHLARMLAIVLLAPLYPTGRLLALAASMQEHRDELVRLQADVQLGKAELSDLVLYLLYLLAEH